MLAFFTALPAPLQLVVGGIALIVANKLVGRHL